jgi:hypothetical protein
MRRVCAALALGVVMAAAAVAPATAGTTAVPVSMTFIEVFGPPQADCPDIAIAYNCGTGIVVPFGMATEEIAFGEGCGGTCDFREVEVAGDALFLDETLTGVSCPGACASQSFNPPFRGTLSDVVVGGTGAFEGATGTLTGTVSASGRAAQIQLRGTITLDP